MTPKIYDEASQTNAVDGNVAVEGPDGVSVTLTPQAAVETSDRLLESALAAEGQRAAVRYTGLSRTQNKIPSRRQLLSFSAAGPSVSLGSMVPY